MQIKSAANDTVPTRRKQAWRPKFVISAVAIAGLIVIGLAAASGNVSLEAAKNFAKDRGLAKGTSISRALVGAVPRIINGYFSKPDLPTLQIDIKFRHLKKLRDKRAEALKKGRLITAADDLVPATLTVGGKTVRIRMRLKGDWLDHLRGEKWSFRIQTRGGEEVLGMRRFSLQHPRTRGFQGETLFMATLRKFDILAPRYFFVNLSVNGQDLGVMAIEEHFSKELLEYNGRKEGVIARFDESLFWASLTCGGNPCFNSLMYTPFNNYRNADINAFRSGSIAKSRKLSSDYRVAVGLLRAFVRGELPASEVFDADRLGAFIAVAEIWSSWHSIVWNNQRYYLNPYTMKLEPIGFDGNVNNPDIQRVFREPIVIQMLRDKKVYAAYRRTAQQLAQDVASGELIRELKEVENKYLPVLRDEFYFLGSYDYRQLIMRARTSTTERNYPILAHANIVEGADGTPYLELSNATEKDVQIDSLEWIGDNGTHKFEASVDVRLPLILPGLGPPFSVPQLESLPPPRIERIPFKRPDVNSLDRLQITASIPGSSVRVIADAKPYFPAISQTPMPRSDLDGQLARHPFLEVSGLEVSGLEASGSDQILKVKAGVWRVSGAIIVPRGYSLEIPAGTTLRFDPDGAIIAYDPVRFMGTAEAPIVLEGDTATWQGIAVMDAGGQSEWTHVRVRNTTGVSQGAWQLTGGVNFYKSDIRLVDSMFEGHRGEDALNIVSSAFEMEGVTITDTTSDAFDGDFTTGTIRNSAFRDIGKLGGGDAVDVSGSQVSVEGSRFERINDKALSVGEGSTMRATNLIMNDVGVGAASKDNSRLNVSDTQIAGARVAGLMAYIKKPEYGGAEIVAEQVTIADGSIPARVQEGSRISLNGNPITPESVDVEQLYNSVMKPGTK